MCEHFEGVLKVMGLLKALVMKVPDLASESKNVGMFSTTPGVWTVWSMLWGTPWCSGAPLGALGHPLVLWDTPWCYGEPLGAMGHPLVLWDTPWCYRAPLGAMGHHNPLV